MVGRARRRSQRPLMLGEEEDIPGGCVVGAPPDSQRGKEEKTTRTRTGQSFRGDKRRRDTRRSSNSSIAHPITIHKHHTRRRGGYHTRTDRPGQSDMAFRSRRDPYSPHQTNPPPSKEDKRQDRRRVPGSSTEMGGNGMKVACFLSQSSSSPTPPALFVLGKKSQERREALAAESSPVQFSPTATAEQRCKGCVGGWSMYLPAYEHVRILQMQTEEGGRAGGRAGRSFVVPVVVGCIRLNHASLVYPVLPPKQQTAAGLCGGASSVSWRERQEKTLEARWTGTGTSRVDGRRRGEKTDETRRGGRLGL
ncbi:hypothetical protein HDK90DRAFT_45192 [Phyllosticta capitalensis]|uniref:Uncharacterized protein n=1 Tax=Phyllosticta capitalensis TaxID=121624 RepID=A0ABR1Z556_9PEZI